MNKEHKIPSYLPTLEILKILQRNYGKETAAYIRQTRESLDEIYKEFFDAVGEEVKCIHWLQYTPYEIESSFYATDPTFLTCTWQEYQEKLDTEEEGWDEYIEDCPAALPVPYGLKEEELSPLQNICNDFTDIQQGMGDILDKIYGDSSEVIIEPGKITTEDYYHE